MVSGTSEPGGGSVADVLGAVSASVPATLVTPQAWQRLVTAAQALPLSGGGGLECYPGCADRAGLGVRYQGTELSRLASFGGISTGVAMLARYLSNGAHRMWVELDVRADLVPAMSVFAGPGNPPGGRPVRLPEMAEWDVVIDTLWPAAPPEASEGVAWLLRALPHDAWIGYLGVMRRRDLRATVSGVVPHDVPGLLQRLRWPGDPAVVAGVVDIAHRSGARLTLGFDLTYGLGPKLGVELAVLSADGWPGLLADAAKRLKLAEGAVGPLLGWAGDNLEEARWRDETRIVRRLNHLTFGFDGVHPPQVKVCLYYGLVA